jgi:seryl-tRNA synthetase
MLSINLIREKKDFIIDRLKIKNFYAEEILDRILELDASRREIQIKTDALQSEMNSISKHIGALMKEGRKEEADAAREKTYLLKEEIKLLQDKASPIEEELRNEIIRLPNLHTNLLPPDKALMTTLL